MIASVEHKTGSRLAETFQVYLQLKGLFLTGAETMDGDRWEQLASALEAYQSGRGNQFLRQGLELVRPTLSGWCSEFNREVVADFNRLFVGPDKLLAPPYESVYLSDTALVMQEATLAVRAAYRQAGLVINRLYAEPDDHIGLEMEFLCYLLARAIHAKHSRQQKAFLDLYESFMGSHLLRWGYDFSRAVLENARTGLLQGIGFCLYGFLQEEARELGCANQGGCCHESKHSTAQIR